VDLSTYDPRSTTGFPKKGKADAPKLMAKLESRIRERQAMLFAQGRSGDGRRVLVVCRAWTPPAREALSDTRWRSSTRRAWTSPRSVRRQRRSSGMTSCGGSGAPFPPPAWSACSTAHTTRTCSWPRSGPGAQEGDRGPVRSAISAFESELAEQGVIVVKCFLHIDREVQRERLLARLDDPTKHWKYDPGDLDDRAHWDDYIAAYRGHRALQRPSGTPWYIVPAGPQVVPQLGRRLAAAGAPRPPRPVLARGGLHVEEQKRLLLGSS
jgi:hypothetical protein